MAQEDATRSEPSVTSPAPKARPVVLFADTKHKQPDATKARFDKEGLDVQFVATVEVLINELSRPEVFCVFLNLEFGGNGLAALKRLAASAPAVYWIVMAGGVSTQVRSAIYQMGAADILQLPTNPVQCFLRARMMLSKWAQKNDFSDQVELPAGYEWKKSQGPGGLMSRESTGGDVADTMNFVRGAYDARGSDVTFVRGGDDKDSVSAAPATNADAPRSRGSLSTNESGDRAGPSVTLVRGDDKAPPIARTPGSGELPRAEPSATMVRADTSVPLGKIPPLTPSEPSPPVRAVAATYDQRDLSSKASIAKPETRSGINHVSNSRRGPPAGPAPQFNMDFAKGPAAKSYRMLYDDVVKASRELAPVTESERLRAPRAGEDFPLADPSAFEGVKHAVMRICEYLSWQAKLLGAARLSVVSVRDFVPQDAESMPTSFVNLVSSDLRIEFNEKMPMHRFPQIHASFQQGKGLFVEKSAEVSGFTDSSRLDEKWSLDEMTSAVVPLCEGDTLEIVLFAQFTRKPTDEDLLPVRLLAFELSAHPNAWRVLDFLGRIYRELES